MAREIMDGVEIKSNLGLDGLIADIEDTALRLRLATWALRLSTGSRKLISLMIDKAFMMGKTRAAMELHQLMPKWLSIALATERQDALPLRLRRVGNRAIRGVYSLVTTNNRTWLQPIRQAMYFNGGRP